MSRDTERDGDWVEHRHRVIYADTDAMGVVYYGTYARFLEVGRNELFRARGGVYRGIEEAGFMLPVTELRVAYRVPARYDDELVIRTRVESDGRARLRFDYQIRRGSDDVLLASGSTVHGCIDATTGRPRRLPPEILEPLGLSRA